MKGGVNNVSKLIKQIGHYHILRSENKISKSVPYIVYNTELPFSCGHCHIKTMSMANDLIYYAQNNIIPEQTGLYYFKNLLRISDDEKYRKKIKKEIKKREKKNERHKRNKKHK